MKEIVRLVEDDADFFEVHEPLRADLIVASPAMGGAPVGIVGISLRR